MTPLELLLILAVAVVAIALLIRRSRRRRDPNLIANAIEKETRIVEEVNKSLGLNPVSHRLSELKRQRSAGLISDDEYARKRSELLDEV